MNDQLIVNRLAALSHPARLGIVRLLVRAGPSGLPAGRLGEALGVSPNALTFHLQKLSGVGLVTARREGQFVIYSAIFADLFDLMDSLLSACCADTREKCGPRCATATIDLTAQSVTHNKAQEEVQDD